MGDRATALGAGGKHKGFSTLSLFQPKGAEHHQIDTITILGRPCFLPSFLLSYMAIF